MSSGYPNKPTHPYEGLRPKMIFLSHKTAMRARKCRTSEGAGRRYLLSSPKSTAIITIVSVVTIVDASAVAINTAHSSAAADAAAVTLPSWLWRAQWS